MELLALVAAAIALGRSETVTILVSESRTINFLVGSQRRISDYNGIGISLMESSPWLGWQPTE